MKNSIKSITIPAKILKNDKLDRKIIIEALGNAIYKKLNQDPIISGNIFLLDGSWGSGKSWCIAKLKDWFKEDSKTKDIVVSDYSAWQYFSEKELFFDFWSHLEPETFTKEKAKEGLEFISNSIEGFDKVKNVIGNFGEKTEQFSETILNQLSFMNSVCGDNEFLNFFSEFATDHIPFIKQIKQTAKNLSELKDKKDQLELLEKMIEALQKIKTTPKYEEIFTNTNPYRDIKIKKTLIILEDLDRVSEDKLWRIFSLLSLFEENKNIVFLLVGSSKFLVEIIEKKYHVKDEGENFLAKFITLKFVLPKALNYSIFESLFRQNIPYLNIASGQHLLLSNGVNTNKKTNKLTFEIYLDLFSYRDFENNFKDYFTKLIMFSTTKKLICVSKYSFKYTPFIACLLLLKNLFPDYYSELVGFSYDSQKLEKYLNMILNSDCSVNDSKVTELLVSKKIGKMESLGERSHSSFIPVEEKCSIYEIFDDYTEILSSFFLINNSQVDYRNHIDFSEDMDKTTIQDIQTIIHAIESF